MPRHALSAIFALAIISVFAMGTSRAQINILTQIGVADVSKNRDGCLTIVNSTLRGNDEIYLIYLEKPQYFITTQIVNRLSQSCSKNADIPKGASFYSFRIKEAKKEIIWPTIAVADYKGILKVEKGNVHTNLIGGGTFESFRVCTSKEGLHLTVWDHEPIKGKRLWHEYYYLGYDVETSCTERDYEQ
jgi:hypothetical protein